MCKRAWWLPERALTAAVFSVPLSLAALVGCKDKGQEPKAAASAAASASAAPAEAAGRTVRLDRRPAHIGEKRHAKGNSVTKLSVEFWKEGEKLGTNESVRKENYESTLTVAGLVGGAPAKGTVHYDHYKLEEVTANQPPSDPPSLEGKTYLLDAMGEKLVINGDGGKPVPPAELEALKKLHSGLGKGDQVVNAIGDAPFTEGKPLAMRRELLHALVTSGSGDLKSGRIWLDSVRTEAGREIAVFKWAADTQSQEQNGLEITWHMTGTTVVALSPAATLSMALTGSLDVSGETEQGGARVTMAGAGTITDESTFSTSTD